jgi:predicted NBD/HSP70 family sugar kinase
MLITPDEGVECGCRNKGCFMSWCSGRYIPQQIRRRAAAGAQTSMDLGEKLDCVELARALPRGAIPLAMEILEQTAHYLGVCVFNIYQLLNVNLYVFGGGLVNFGPLLFDRVRREFDRYKPHPAAGRVPLRRAQAGLRHHRRGRARPRADVAQFRIVYLLGGSGCCERKPIPFRMVAQGYEKLSDGK